MFFGMLPAQQSSVRGTEPPEGFAGRWRCPLSSHSGAELKLKHLLPGHSRLRGLLGEHLAVLSKKKKVQLQQRRGAKRKINVPSCVTKAADVPAPGFWRARSVQPLPELPHTAGK